MYMNEKELKSKFPPIPPCGPSKFYNSLNISNFIRFYREWVNDNLIKLSSSFLEKDLPIRLEEHSIAKTLLIQFDEKIFVGVSVSVEEDLILLHIFPVLKEESSEKFDLNKTSNNILFKEKLDIAVPLEFIETHEFYFYKKVLNCAFTCLYFSFKLRIFSSDETKKYFENLKKIARKFDFKMDESILKNLNNLFNEDKLEFFKYAKSKDFDLFI